jgi:chromosomal replication initiation ATPase DnaA
MIIVLKPRSAAMTPSLNLSLVKRLLPRRRHAQPFELLDNLPLDLAFKEEMRAFVIDLAEQLNGRRSRSSNPLILVKAPRGSGKTYLVRALTSALFRLGALGREKPREIDFTDVRAQCIGQSELKSREQCKAALDGVLNIDDLYMLRGDFGEDAFETVRRFAVENERRIVVFFENTPWRADQFFEACPHLKPAFGRIVEFPALNAAQLWDIFKRLAARRWISLPDGTEALLMPELERRIAEFVWPRGHWHNGREMDFLLEAAARMAREREGLPSHDPVIPEIKLVDIALAKAALWSRR